MTASSERITYLLLIIAASLPITVGAELFDQGGSLIYDDVLDVTWLQDAN